MKADKIILRATSLTNSHLILANAERTVCGCNACHNLREGGRHDIVLDNVYAPNHAISCYRCQAWIKKHKIEIKNQFKKLKESKKKENKK